MPRARRASHEARIEGGGKRRVARQGERGSGELATMHGPVTFEISRSSRISPSIAPLYHEADDASLVLDAARGLDGDHPVDCPRIVQQPAHGEHSSAPSWPGSRPGSDPLTCVGLHGLGRKLAHLIEYAILALLWFRALVRDTGAHARCRGRPRVRDLRRLGGPRRDPPALRAESHGHASATWPSTPPGAPWRSGSPTVAGPGSRASSG